ncbi:unnamed protein product [Parascedosporium putredinis]|uniref:Zn(2)-C6 fungal-type domain-containing protein n=1 Tax=Parascedosporium putredinis TaxID=1442378 RepID=A0A9P1GZI1_9PEZI|nr:unnamed protein product [Parascedosporium putredinis]CAI7990799.1 unnamed protein product [Parascedosporium putredinis]
MCGPIHKTALSGAKLAIRRLVDSRFAQDLLKRHMSCHDPSERRGKRQRRHQNQGPRVSQACKACAAAKLKCDENPSCSRCQQRGILCQRESRTMDRLMAVADSPSAGAQPASAISPPCTESSKITMTQSSTDGHSTTTPTPDGNPSPLFSIPRSPSTHLHLGLGQPATLAEHDFSSFLRDVVTAVERPATTTVTTTAHFGTLDEPDFDTAQALHGLLDFTIDGDFGFEDVAMGLSNLPTSPSHYFAAIQPLSSASATNSSHPGAPGPGHQQKHIALGIEAPAPASRASPRWGPAPESFNVPQFEPDQSLADKKIPVTARDEILSMVLSNCRPEKKRLVTKAFPAPALLDTLIRAFFSYHRYEVDSFVHEASFNVSQQRPELLAAIISSGATLTDSKLLHTVGFAMEETLRSSLRQVCEEENAATRKLWVLQGFTCHLEVGIWSGIKRKIEISESHRQHPYTQMLRRAGRFNAASYHPAPPLPSDTGALLHQKWHAWVEHESFNRISYRAFITDTQASVALSTNPLISFAEMKTPMPTSRHLWLARSAEEWKAVYLSLPRAPTTASLVDYMNAPADFDTCYDVHFCQVIVLCGSWGMFWHYHQLRDELPARPEAALLLELLYMHLHMPFQEVELFAGKGTLDDARRALPVLRGWLDNEESRRAVWHAGQVLRAAATFRPMHLRAFFAIGVYQAALTIWVYSIAPQIKGGSVGMANAAAAAAAAATTAAPTLHQPGKPDLCVIRPGGSHADMMPPIPLTDQESIVNMVQETLNDNFQGCDALPPLVENLNLLLHNLGRAATSIKT